MLELNRTKSIHIFNILKNQTRRLCSLFGNLAVEIGWDGYKVNTWSLHNIGIRINGMTMKEHELNLQDTDTLLLVKSNLCWVI